MVPYDEIRIAIARGLSEYIGRPVTPVNGGGDIPKGAFLTYQFDGFGSTGKQPIEFQEEDHMMRLEMVPFAVSFLSYGDETVSSMNLALQARDWFKAQGKDRLKELDVVVSDMGPVENRDIQIGTEWERRHGFEIEFRTTDRLKTELIPINQVNLKGAGVIVSH